MTFYNRCSFLIHTRKHYSFTEGRVNLGNVDIIQLPVDLAGFARHESIPFLYDEEEEYINDGSYINSQFYTPDDNESGKQIITLRPFSLVFHYTEADDNVLMVLKQICSNIPLCEFVNQNFNKEQTTITDKDIASLNLIEPEIKQEVDPDEFTIPIISKIESLNKNNGNKCTECVASGMSLGAHFVGTNKPLDETLHCLICKYIAPTKCSLQVSSFS